MLVKASAIVVLVFGGLAMVASGSPQARPLEASTSRCSCECVDGLPQTLCGSVQAAQQQTWVCPPSYSCPVLSHSGAGEAGLREGGIGDVGQTQASALTPPHPQAENCRAVRVWHRQMQAYTTVNICDVQAPRT